MQMNFNSELNDNTHKTYLWNRKPDPSFVFKVRILKHNIYFQINEKKNEKITTEC